MIINVDIIYSFREDVQDGIFLRQQDIFPRGHVRKSHVDHIFLNLGEYEYIFAGFVWIFCVILFTGQRYNWSNTTYLNMSSQMWIFLWSIYNSEDFRSFSFSVYSTDTTMHWRR